MERQYFIQGLEWDHEAVAAASRWGMVPADRRNVEQVNVLRGLKFVTALDVNNFVMRDIARLDKGLVDLDIARLDKGVSDV